jgi:hypothetical protein
MDLSNYDLRSYAEKGFDLTVKDPLSSKDTDITVAIVGSDSRAYRAAKSEAFRLAAEGADSDKISAAMYSKCVTGWSGLMLGENEVEFSEDKALEIFEKFPWLMDQVGLAVEKRSNFMKKPAKS